MFYIGYMLDCLTHKNPLQNNSYWTVELPAVFLSSYLFDILRVVMECTNHWGDPKNKNTRLRLQVLQRIAFGVQIRCAKPFIHWWRNKPQCSMYDWPIMSQKWSSLESTMMLKPQQYFHFAIINQEITRLFSTVHSYSNVSESKLEFFCGFSVPLILNE